MFTNQNKYKKHLFFMRLAIQQAQYNLGNTKENPSVGCVITKNNLLISAGSTSLTGRPHAEQNAINFSKVNLLNSTIYVTLEPCSHYGKTPPCVSSIIEKGIKKVFFSMTDPDPRSFNKSFKKFKEKNISVNSGISYNRVKHFYRSYYLKKKKKLPFVTCKLAVSKDLFSVNKNNKLITNYFSRSRVFLIRSIYDCLITSSQTIIKDNPLLNCRIRGLEKMSPSIIILDNKLKISTRSNIIKNKSNRKILIFFNKKNKNKLKLLKALKIKTYKISLNKEKNLDLKKVLTKTKKLGYSRIFIESGLKLTTNFLKNNLVNDFILFKSNKNIKKNGNGSIKNIMKTFLKKKKGKLEKVNLFGEKLLTFKIK